MGWKGLVSLSLHYETPLCFVDPGKVGCKNHSLVWALLPLHTHPHTRHTTQPCRSLIQTQPNTPTLQPLNAFGENGYRIGDYFSVIITVFNGLLEVLEIMLKFCLM